MFRIKMFYICIFLFIALLTPVTAQNQETLAVLDFTTEAVSATEMNAIVEFLSAELFNTKKYIVIDVSQRETILGEMEFSLSGCSDETCALEIGKMLSAELIVVGNLSKVGSRYLMSVKMLETETSKTMGTANGKFTDLDELIDGLSTIAYTLAGEETAVVSREPVVVEKQTEPEEPVELKEEETPALAPEAKPSPEPTVTAAPAEPQQPGEFNLLSFIVSAVGTIGMVESGIFQSIGMNNQLAALESYDAYMTAVEDPAQLYSGAGEGDYEYYANIYESMAIAGYSTAAAGGVLSAASVFLGDSYLSFGGKLASAAGTLVFTAGNVTTLMAANNVLGINRLYDDYLAAGNAETSTSLYAIYEEAFNNYQIQQYLGYGLWGAGGILAIGSFFIPGEQTAAASSLLEKIIMSVGYLCLSGGNFTSSMALNERFNAEDAWDDYMSATSPEAATALNQTYDNYYGSYESLTYITYGLWGAGAAAIIAGLMIPEDTDSVKTADSDFDFMVRPALTGFGLEVDIKLK